MKIIARKEAKAAGLPRYFTGKPCERGHIAERYVSTRACVVCGRAHDAARYAAHPEQWRARGAARYARNPEQARARKAAWRANNPERAREATAAWQAKNPEKKRETTAAWRAAHPDECRAYQAAWQQNNPGKCCANTAKRKARKLQATPPCSNLELIKAVYEAAARKGLVVDHVIPLKHPLVCGLHVPFNLQLLTASANSAKGNTWPPIRL